MLWMVAWRRDGFPLPWHWPAVFLSSVLILWCLRCVQGKIKKLEDIFLFSMPIKEYQIVEFFLGTALKDEVMKIMPVQKQTRAGQRTRFKASARPHSRWLFPACTGL